MERHAIPTADDLRAELARRRLAIHIVAGRVGVHPVRLSEVLNGRIPLRPDLAERILRAIEEQAR